MKIFQSSFATSIAGASIILVIFSLLSKVVGFLREIIYANNFGLSSDFDIYLISAAIPFMINTSIMYIGQHYFIPHFTSLSLTNKPKSFLFLKFNFIAFILFGFLISLIFFLFSSQILSIFLTVDKASNERVELIFYLFLITIPLNGGISVLSAYRQQERDFISPSIAALLLNIVIIAALVGLSSTIGILTIGIGYASGSILQLVYLIYKSNLKGFFSIADMSGFAKNHNIIYSSLIMIIIIESIGQLYNISDRFFIKYVETGDISAINYAQTIISLPISIISVSLGTAMFPQLSNDFHNDSMNEFRHRFREAVGISLFIFALVFLVFHFYGLEIVKVIFERGEFSTSDSYRTTLALKYFNFGLLFYALYIIFHKTLYGARYIKEILFIILFGILIKIVFNFLFVAKIGYIAMVIGTSLSYFFFFLTGAIVIKKYFKIIWFFASLKDLSFLIVNGIICFYILEIFWSLITSQNKIVFLVKILFFIVFCLVNLMLVKNKIIQNIFSNLKVIRFSFVK